MGKYTDASWLREQYWGREKPQKEIAEGCDVSTRTIRRYMKRHGIERREMKGAQHLLYGTKRPESVRTDIAQSLEGREFSEETKQRLAEAHRGNEIPEEVREKIATSVSGTACSKETRERMSESTAGANNPNWKGGYSRRYGPGWATARDRVLERDTVCQCCGHDGSDHRLEVHHIVPVREFRNDPEKELRDAHELHNLVLLCRRCHGKAEHGCIDAPSPSADDH